MKRNLRKYLIVTIVILSAYSLLSNFLIDYWEESYGIDMNDFRKENNLPILSGSYQLGLTDQSNKDLSFQKWNLRNNLIPSRNFHVSKSVFYRKSPWIWKNAYLGESDDYKIEISPDLQIEMYSLYDHLKNEWTFMLDTNMTDFARKKEEQKRDKAYQDAADAGFYLCGNSFVQEFSFSEEISKDKFEAILNEWTLK